MTVDYELKRTIITFDNKEEYIYVIIYKGSFSVKYGPFFKNTLFSK